MHALLPSRVPPRAALAPAASLPLLAVLLAAWAATAALAVAGWAPRTIARALGVAAAHGTLLGAALAMAGVGARAQGAVVGILAAAALAAAAHPAGVAAWAAPPCALALLARRGRLATLGLGGPTPWKAVGGGALLGGLLGAHLLVSASLTLGRRVRPAAPDELLAWAGYDVGANVLAAECFFRGVVFRRAWRRWPFVGAAALSTAVYVARYLVDPLLPKSVEMIVGAVFYLAVLGVGNCWLLARTGDLRPGLAGATVFFAAYRLLGPA